MTCVCLREQITYGDLYYTVPQAHQTDVKDVIYCSIGVGTMGAMPPPRFHKGGTRPP